MFPALLEKLNRRHDLTSDEAAAAMTEIIEGRADRFPIRLRFRSAERIPKQLSHDAFLACRFGGENQSEVFGTRKPRL